MFRSLFFLVVTSLVSSVALEPNYTVTAPERIRPGSTYKFIVSIYGVKFFSYNLNVKIARFSNPPLVEQNFQSIRVSTRVFQLNIPSLVPDENYNFVVNVTGGLTFYKGHAIYVNQKSHSIFIQTDKYIYKPGQTVMFRVIGILSDLKPYTRPFNISIYDQSDNKIYQLVNQQNQSGVISGELKLSDVTPLGRWKIKAVSQTSTKEVYFEVAEYVLPKFEVKVILPSYFVQNVNNPSLQKKLTVTITALYTFGKPVIGRATALVRLEYFSSNSFTILKTVSLVDGKADLILSLYDLQSLIPSWYGASPLLNWQSIFVQANVTETVTGNVIQGYATVTVRTTRYNLEFVSSTPRNFKPGFTYFARLRLAQVDNTDPLITDIKVGGMLKKLTVVMTSYVGTKNTIIIFYVPLNENGYALLEIPTLSNSGSISIEATFYDDVCTLNSTAHLYLTPFSTRDRKFIQLTLLGNDVVVKPGLSLRFKVTTSEKIRSFEYQILGKGGIYQNNLDTLATPNTETTFSIPINANMALNLAPQAKIVVFCITSSGELIADSLSLSVTDYFANKVSLSFNTSSASPGNAVELRVTAARDSVVSLLAVDQSVLLLNAGNDLTKELVESDLSGYNSGGGFTPGFIFPIWLGGENTNDLLINAGVFVMTNFFIQKYEFLPWTGFVTRPGITEPPRPPRPQSTQGQPGPQGPQGTTIFFVPPPPSNPKSVIPRKIFPETWIWTDVKMKSDGTLSVNYKVPDTITSWTATAFASSERVGLGLSGYPTKITVMKPFFISANLPYSIVRGEQFALQVTVFNYYGRDLQASVTLESSTYFKVRQCKGNGQGEPENVAVTTYTSVKNNDATSIYFWIIPTALVQIPIKVVSNARVAADAVIVNLLSKPEGQSQFYSTSSLIRISTDDSLLINFYVSLPPLENVVSGSVLIEATIIGDILGTTINNLDKLLQMPSGCGEQNMLHLAPDVYILKYLTASRQLTTEINTRALIFINTGFQTELTYQRNDGSFSAFGNRDQTGSVWLSAFVAKVFTQAREYIPVDDDKISQTLTWVISRQSANGSFSEPPGGRVIHTDMQGGSSSGLSLTAYVVISLLENMKNNVNSELQNSISLAVKYLERQYESYSNNPYILAIIGYVFHLADSSHLSNVLELLDQLAIIDGGMKYWHKVQSTNNPSGGWLPPYSRPQSVDIEMTSYVLLTYASREDISNSLPIAKWLIKQRNPQGGFSSTQDTVLGLEALTLFASQIISSTDSQSISVQVSQDVNNEIYVFETITKENALILQSHQLPPNTTQVTFSASGEGLALAQLNVRYNVKTEVSNRFLDQTLSTVVVRNRITVNICVRWSGLESSGMVLIEFYLLTGYMLVDDYATTLMEQIGQLYKKNEFRGDHLAIYLDELTTSMICFSITIETNMHVSDVKPALVKTYRYYDTNTVVVGYYSTPNDATQPNACTRF